MELQNIFSKVSKCLRNELKTNWIIIRDDEKHSITITRIANDQNSYPSQNQVDVKREPGEIFNHDIKIEDSKDLMQKQPIVVLRQMHLNDFPKVPIKLEDPIITPEIYFEHDTKPMKEIEDSEYIPFDNDFVSDKEEETRKNDTKTKKKRIRNRGGKLPPGRPQKYPISTKIVYKKIPGTNEYFCNHDNCKKTFKTAAGFRGHFLKIHTDIKMQNSFFCDLCSDTFFYGARLRWHKDVKHPETINNETTHVCDTCGRKFSDKSNLTYHKKKSHESTMNYNRYCRVCRLYIEKDKKTNEDEKPSWSESMVRHFTANHPLELHYCSFPDCIKKFVCAFHLKIHFQRSHENAGKKFQCPYCVRSFYADRQLNMHMDSAHPQHVVGDFTFRCDHPKCEKIFSSPQNLAKHVNDHKKRESMKVNGKVPRKECKICHVKVSPFYISIHMRNIHGPKPLPQNCPECGVICVSDRALKDHTKKYHSGIIYPCNFCSKSFNYRNGLEVHIERIHEKIRHSCPRCEKSYSAKKELLGHIKAFHEGLRYKCRICDKEFLRGPDRNRHEKSYHRAGDSPPAYTPRHMAEIRRKENREVLRYTLGSHRLTGLDSNDESTGTYFDKEHFDKEHPPWSDR